MTDSAFYKEMSTCVKTKVLSDKALQEFISIARKEAGRYKYAHPEDAEDAYMSAISDLIKHWHHFNPDKTKDARPFYHTIARSGIIRFYHSQRHNRVTEQIDPSKEPLI